MKNANSPRVKGVACGLAVLIFVLLGVKANAQILITIDVTNPGAVVFTATGSAPSANGGNVPGIDGIDFLQFFNTALTGFQTGNLSPSNLSPYLDRSDSSAWYHSWYDDSYSGSNVDLTFYSNDGSSQHFNTTSPAFFGSATVDLSAYVAYLPSYGATGQITDGNSGDAGGPSRPLTVLGTWKVTAAPESSSYILVGLGVVALLLLKYKRPGLS